MVNDGGLEGGPGESNCFKGGNLMKLVFMNDFLLQIDCIPGVRENMIFLMPLKNYIAPYSILLSLLPAIRIRV